MRIILGFIFAMLLSTPGWAADTPTPTTVNPPSAQSLSPAASTANAAAATLNVPYTYPITDPTTVQQLAAKTTVIELFTSLDCLFCPRAENLVSDISSRGAGITFACHTDPEGPNYPLARTFCADRQARYARTLSDGLAYTPQLIINGHIDAVGHEFNDVAFGLKKAAASDTLTKLTLRNIAEQQGMFAIDVPKIDLGTDHTADISVITLRAPVTVPKSMPQSLTHPAPLTRVANRFLPIGGWHGQAKTVTLSWAPVDDEIGFIVIIQKDNGPIVAAGEWVKKD